MTIKYPRKRANKKLQLIDADSSTDTKINILFNFFFLEGGGFRVSKSSNFQVGGRGTNERPKN